MSRNLIIRFNGGAEGLFGGVKEHKIQLSNSTQSCWTMRNLLVWLRDNLLQDKPEMFLQGSSVRPGILVVINDVDWELCGELDYELADRDTVLFISTLHGG